jgi:hypothetical protein
MNKKQVLIIFAVIILFTFVFFVYVVHKKNLNNKFSVTNTGEELQTENTLEYKIKNIYAGNVKKEKIAYNFAKQLEGILNVKNFDEVDLDEFVRATDCMSFNTLGSDIGLIENLVFDTDEKMDKYIDFNNYQSGKVFGNDDLENLNCDF